MIEHWQAAKELTESGTAFVVATLIACRGHVPQDVGAKAIVAVDGLRSGTVGGGKVEARAIDFARKILSASKRSDPQVVTWNLTTDIGMTCGGEVTFLFEAFHTKRRQIALFGAGHVAQALVRTLANLDFYVTCFDSRADWLDRMPMSHKLATVRTDDLPAAVATMNSNCYFVVMTQGHASDLPVLKEIYKQFPDAPYVGVMGSDVKAKKIRHDLLESGIKSNLVETLRSPIGLPLGGNQPFEIAISVVAEILQVDEFTL